MIQTQPHFGPDLGMLGLRQSLDIMISYYHVQYQKKLMIQSSENLVMDGLTDESDFARRCLTNVERPKI